MCTKTIPIALLLVAVGLMIFISEPTEAKTIIVDDDWAGADYSTIGEAISAASEGDTIRVYEGTYVEDNMIDKSIDLIGNGTATIIDGDKGDHTHGFILQGGNINVSGFKFYDWWPSHEFAAIGVYSDGNRIFDNVFYYNLHGIFLQNCRDNEIVNNSFDYNYYAITVYEDANDCNVSFNTFSRAYMAEILWSLSSGNVFYSNTFFNISRRALSPGRSDNITISFNMFDMSQSKASYGAVQLNKNSDTDVSNNTFIKCPYGVYDYGAINTRVTHNTFDRCGEAVRVGRAWPDIPARKGSYDHNNFLSCDIGINATGNLGVTVDGEHNWWGDATGPYHYANNTAGRGDVATDDVDFVPWLRTLVSPLPPIACIVDIRPALTNEGEDVTFVGRALARNYTVEHVWRSSIDGEIYRGSSFSFILSNLSNGTHTIYLKVKDEYGKWCPEVSTTLMINGRPRAIIDGISPTLSNEGDTVSFSAGYIDDEDDVNGFHWESDVDGILSNGQTFSTDGLSNGTHTITLMVRDGYEAWSQTVSETIVINGIPRAWIKEIEPVSADEGQRVNFDGAYYDHEGEVLDHEWVSDIDGVLSDQKSFSTYSLSNGTHTITFRVMDGNATWSGFATSSVTVNGIPRAQIASIAPEKVTQGDVVAFRGGYIDHENDVASYEWTSDIDGTLSFLKDFATSDLSVGSHVITFKVMDRTGIWSEAATATLSVNGRPLAFIDLVVPEGINEGETVELQGSYDDPEDDVQEFLWESDIDGVLSDQAAFKTAGLSRGIHAIIFRVRDGFGAWSKDATVTVVVNGIPSAFIESIDPSRANQGEEVVLTGTFEDFENDVVTYEWDSDIDGPLSTDISFTTTSLTVGTHAISFRVMDGAGVWSRHAVGTVSINGGPVATIISVGPAEVYRGDLVGFVAEATDDGIVSQVLWASSIDGVIGDQLTFTRSDLSMGDHVITLKVADDDGVWSEEVSARVTVLRHPLDLSIEEIAFETPVQEGDDIIISTRIMNTGRRPASGVIVEIKIDGELVGSEDTTEPLEPGQSLVMEMNWMAATGEHTVSVQVLYEGVVHTSSTSEVILVVNPVPEEPADPSPVPGVVDNGGTFDAYHLMEPPLVYLVTLIIAVIIVLVSYALLVIGRGGLLPRD